MIVEATKKMGVVLTPLKYLASWCILATDSGGNARYWVVMDDNDELNVFKLSKDEITELDFLLTC